MGSCYGGEKRVGSAFRSLWLAIPTILLARWVRVAAPVAVMRRWRTLTPGTVTIMTLGGLRAALSLPADREREIVLAVTNLVVIFSILVKRLSLKRVVRGLVES